MNKQPVDYKQYDKRWADKPYRKEGGTGTIKGSGCGPSCAAMLIETITGKTYTPEDACNWSMEHGFRTLNQGTEYAYFVPQFKEFGIDCSMLNWTNTYGKPNHANHARAVELLKKGYYLIALMGKGTWTSGGHFVVVWWQDGKVRINDPASTKDARLNGDLATFKKEVRHYWVVDARKHNKNGKAVEDKKMQTVKVELPVLEQGMTGEAVLSWQQVLVAKGYDPEGVDGKFGPGCKAATIAYQKDHGLKQDGKVGPEVYGSVWPV